MTTPVLRFGLDQSIEFDLPAEALVGEFNRPLGEPLSDVAAAVREAIERPLDFPPLILAAVPGDRIVLALDAAVPQLPVVVATIVEAFLAHGSRPEEITILQTAEGGALRDPRERLPAALREQIGLQTHNPAKGDEHCHLTFLADGQEIRIHRALFDADVVIPIGCLRVRSSWEYGGIHDCIFPAFADAASQQHFREAAAATAEQRKMRRAEVDEVAWNLGIILTVQVVPGADEEILHVLAGDPKQVAEQGYERTRAAWTIGVSQRADLVVLGLDGNAAQQSWDNLARAVSAGLRLVERGGAIALCTELNTPPSDALRSLIDVEDSAAAIRRIRKQHSPDAPAATKLARALSQAKLYLLSQLDEETVEDLGLAAVSESADIARLASRSQSCILVSHAQFAAGHLIKQYE
ncbi:MAG TPA: lactate racemase domain-containing protein [Pirellulales bacterium]|jgi:nickel-dependent lactate racemase|nr:lactate racemase domain-containing protein [Pirellulales bacterium]